VKTRDDPCPSCDRAYVGGAPLSEPSGTRPCPICRAPLCRDQHPGWPIPPEPPACDLWFGHEGLHRSKRYGLEPHDLVWGEGEATWEHGRRIQTWRFTGYAPDASQESPCFYDGAGEAWDAGDFVPDGAGGQLGDWTITVTFQPKERS
jgi:hypothetical protein